MICRTRAGLGLFVAALFCGGCGTLKNLNLSTPTGEGEIPPPTRIYGGVRQDWTEFNKQQCNEVAFIFLPLWLAEFPLSLIGDTLTLPYTAGVEVTRSINDYYFPKTPAKPEPGNALSSLAGNKFNAWTISPRIEMPVTSSSPP